MTNENNNIQRGRVRVVNFWETDEFKKFLASTLATFLGVFFALCLFSATHKSSPRIHHPVRRPAMHHQVDRLDRGIKADVDKKMNGKENKRVGKNEIGRNPVRVRVESEKK